MVRRQNNVINLPILYFLRFLKTAEALQVKGLAQTPLISNPNPSGWHLFFLQSTAPLESLKKNLTTLHDIMDSSLATLQVMKV